MKGWIVTACLAFTPIKAKQAGVDCLAFTPIKAKQAEKRALNDINALGLALSSLHI